MRLASSALAVNDRRGGTKVDLGFFTRSNFDASKGKRLGLIQFGDVSPHAVILAGESMIVDEFLKDPLSRKSLLKFGQDEFMKQRTEAPRPDGRFGWF